MQIPSVLVVILVLVVAVSITEAEAYTVDPVLIQAVRGYAAETQYGAEHVERWNRVLDAFGVISHTSNMTAAQAQEMADKYSANRWNPIVEALTAIEDAKKQDQQQSQQQQQQDPQVVEEPIQYTVDTALVQTVQGYATETQYGAEHVDRWNRVLDAFGVLNHTSSMNSTQAQQMADNFSAKRWNPIVEALTAIEDAKKQDQQQQQSQQDPPPQQSQQQQQQVNPNTCNWDDPDHVNPPSCFAPQTQQSQTGIQQYERLKKQAWPIHNEIVDVKNVADKWQAHDNDLSLGINNTFNQYDDLNASPLRNLEFIITSGDELLEDHPSQVNGLINDLKWAIPQAQTTLNQMKNLLAQFPLPSYCLKISTDCTFHDNGRILNYTTTGDPFVVNQGTQWEREIPGLTTIIIHDEKGNVKTTEHKYGDVRDTYTEYHPNSPVIKNYMEYRADGTKMYQSQQTDPDLRSYKDYYFWDDGIAEKGIQVYGEDVVNPSKQCENKSGMQTPCTSKYYFDKFLHPRE